MEWSCTIPGAPVGKGRPRFGRSRCGRPVAYTPPKTREWEAMAAQVMRMSWRRPPLEGPVSLGLDAIFDRPRRLLTKASPDERIPHTQKPDRDNVEKIVADALEKAGIVLDDCQVYDGPVRKFYAAKGEEAHVRVVVTA